MPAFSAASMASSICCCGGQRRDPAVWWIDNERRTIRINYGGSTVKPELIVVPDNIRRFLIVTDLKLGKPIRLKLGGFFLRKKLLLSKIFRSLKRSQCSEIPHPIEIRVTPWSPG